MLSLHDNLYTRTPGSQQRNRHKRHPEPDQQVAAAARYPRLVSGSQLAGTSEQCLVSTQTCRGVFDYKRASLPTQV